MLKEDRRTREEMRRLRQKLRRRREWERRINEALDIAIIVAATLLLLLILDEVTAQRGGEITVDKPSAPAEETLPSLEAQGPAAAEAVKAKYFDVPMDRELQDMLRAACEESGIDMELALAVISRESSYTNATGDGGESAGYMQVQEKWHAERMERLGVEDLRDPAGNFRVGCDFIAELLAKYPKAEALTFYNSGTVGVSEYALDVMAREEALRDEG